MMHPTSLLPTSLLTRLRGRRVGRVGLGVAVDPTVAALLAADAPVAIGVSGGKDSCAGALATVAHLDAIGHRGPRVLIHSDLGRVEWRDSHPTCERLAAATGLPLIVVRREAGDMMDRWLVRWRNNVARYADLSCVRLILPWSTPSMRFCTSELKTAIICRDLVRRFAGQTIVSVSGIRRQESDRRAGAPISAIQPKLASKTHRTTGVDWHPLVDWEDVDVYAYLAHRGFELHEAYTRYGLSRVSCAFCIMQGAEDQRAATTCPDNLAIYREMVTLEAVSTFAFQGDHWLGDVAPDLLDEDLRARLRLAKERAAARQVAEARIPKHLLYTKGWPSGMPTPEEAELLAAVRRTVADLLGLSIRYVDASSVLGRYAELIAAREAKESAAAAKARKKALRSSVPQDETPAVSAGEDTYEEE